MLLFNGYYTSVWVKSQWGQWKVYKYTREHFNEQKAYFFPAHKFLVGASSLIAWPTNILSWQSHHQFCIQNVTFCEAWILHLIFHWKYAIISVGKGLKNLRVQKNLVQNSGTNSEISAPRTLFIADDFAVYCTDLQHKTIVIGGHLTTIAVYYSRNCQLGW